ncbi:hypothetical protein CCM_09557 [Cordyceps militaris CM01]|uniref:Uncharacterized protein n=1 Tax=Cordyceps militaris (strain CM01) TaxID=983644 RepID=G3JUG0_CORMM|nr:uncharacterized protein CCM_09557 [Cordyceps militaris CM01]EGX87934.1 hypothetical protein CCM_09557 [Cordyceps militaris CM01]
MKLSLTLALASLGAALPLEERGPSVVVGYRTVSAAQAKIYKDAGNTLVWTQSQSSDQLGPGVYISPNLGDWPATPSDWYCVILADSTPWNPTNKAWVPERHNGKALWWNAGVAGMPSVSVAVLPSLLTTREQKKAANRAAYLREIGGSNFRPDNTVRLSIISGFRLLQLLIPPELIKDPNHLKTRTQCAAKTDEAGVRAIAAYGPVDWSRWPNVKGTPQRP